MRFGLQVLAVTALATAGLAAAASPGDSQEASSLSVTQVSGGAFGAFAELVVHVEADGNPEEVDPQALLDAIAAGDTATVDQILAEAGISLGTPAPEGPPFIDADIVVGPAPQVTLPPTGGGPFADSLAGLDFVINIGEAGTLELTGGLDVVTQGALGPGGFASSSARAQDVNPELEEILFVAADTVETECSADIPSGPRGSTHIVNGETLEDVIPENPAPNTVLIDESEEMPDGGGTLRAELFVIANEQIVSASDITVNGLRTHFLISFIPEGATEPTEFESLDATYTSATCGLLTAPVVQPTFTG